MGVAFRAPRAPIERPERPSSRFSFCRRTSDSSDTETNESKDVEEGSIRLESIKSLLSIGLTPINLPSSIIFEVYTKYK